VVVVGLAGACGEKRISGDGTLVEDTRSLGTFSRVRVEEGFRAEVAPGELAVSVLIDQNLQEYVVTTVQGDLLVITSPRGIELAPSAGARLKLSAPLLVGLETSGSTEVNAELTGSTVTVDSSGDSQIIATVRATESVNAEASGSSRQQLRVPNSGDVQIPSQTLHASGSSEVESLLNSVTTHVLASGSSRVRLRARDAVHADATGASEVTVEGQPALRNINTSGDAKVVFTP
jgi:hypothetical protein